MRAEEARPAGDERGGQAGSRRVADLLLTTGPYNARGMERSAGAQPDLRSAINVLWRRKWLFLAVFVSIPVAVYVISSLVPKTYETYSLIATHTSSTEVPGLSSGTLESVGSEALLVETTTLTKAAAKEMGLPESQAGSLSGSIRADPVTTSTGAETDLHPAHGPCGLGQSRRSDCQRVRGRHRQGADRRQSEADRPRQASAAGAGARMPRTRRPRTRSPASSRSCARRGPRRRTAPSWCRPPGSRARRSRRTRSGTRVWQSSSRSSLRWARWSSGSASTARCATRTTSSRCSGRRFSRSSRAPPSRVRGRRPGRSARRSAPSRRASSTSTSTARSPR